MAKRDKKDLKPVGITDENGNDGSSQSLDVSPVTASPPPAPPTLGSAPTPDQAEAATKEKAPEPKKAERPKPSVPLRVFAVVSGIKPDQFQAFVKYARREEMRPCPVAEWKQRFQDFQNKPVR